MAANPDRETTFRFKQFSVGNREASMKVGTDSVLLGAWVAVEGVNRALDAGCGTGLLALMLAQRGVGHIDAIEIDPVAADEAAANVSHSPWPEAVKIIEGDCTEWNSEPYDLIISNPPYFSNGIISPDERRATARHETSLNCAALMTMASRLLTDNGRLALVSPADRADDIIFRASLMKLHLLRRCDVKSNHRRGVRRVLWEFSKRPTAPTIDCLILTAADGKRSAAYTELTKDFYL